MRYLLLIFVSSVLSLVSGQAIAQAESQRLDVSRQIPSRSTSADFWSQAQRLVQKQITLINRIERASASPDPYPAFGAEGQILLHQGEVDRFLKSQYPNPALLCTRTNGVTPAGSNLTLEQAQVYCALHGSTQQLLPLRPVLERRQAMLAPTRGNPLAIGQPSILTVAPQRLPVPVPKFPAPEPPVVGVAAKTPISGYQPPIQPAIAPSQQTVTTLQTVKKFLGQAVAAFPPSARFTDIAETYQLNESNNYVLYPQEPSRYTEFLSQPNTGIARVLPSAAYRQQLNPLGNRLSPSVAERFPFPALLRGIGGGSDEETTPSSVQIAPGDEFTPRFAVRMEGSNFEIAQQGLDYGFMMDLGEVPLENLDSTLKKARALSPQTRQFFLNYRPPNQLASIQVDRQRFITGKLGQVAFSEPVQDTTAIASTIDRVSANAPAILNHTYLMRLVQFQVPEVVQAGGTVSREQRRYLDQVLEFPSSDVLVAFRPVSRRADGSYTVLWQVLTQFPDPQIEDVEKYIKLQ
ncbi:hypothetical protein [Coleofasciculus sp. FACHB-1120]|uniref:hypothetical protein n=1 Tax=Coleofasciculus sp. FACHB-1120 TaxID=2692783 RepID=UPI001685C5B6|nr:hypothetical protein [Coleofasciculus sp. FACHB-1120]MBD2740087.1 hypothetical protein [Coleofasciculus sp. FACHB-1120]